MLFFCVALLIKHAGFTYFISSLVFGVASSILPLRFLFWKPSFSNLSCKRYDNIISYLFNTFLLSADIWTYTRYWSRLLVLLLSCIFTGILKNCGISNLLFYNLNDIFETYLFNRIVKFCHGFSMNRQLICYELNWKKFARSISQTALTCLMIRK